MKTKLFQNILLQFFLLLSIALSGQAPLVFHHLTTKEGLSNSNINAIMKDSYGFLWVATQYGLNRYDGYGFKTYTSEINKPNSLLSNNITELQEDGQGYIWLTGYKYMIYKRDKDHFITDPLEFLKDIGIFSDENFKVYIDRAKDLWVLNSKQLHHYKTKEKHLKSYEINIQNDDIRTLVLSDNENSIFGIFEPGYLSKIDKASGQQTKIKLPENINTELINKVYADSKGGLCLWSGDAEEIFYQKKLADNWQQIMFNPIAKTRPNRILCLMDDLNGNIWIGTDHNGLFIYNTNNGELRNLMEDRNSKTSVASNNITCLFRDELGIFWIGHVKKGISYYHNSFQNILNVEHPFCRDVSIFLEDREGRLWLGTDGNGLYLKENPHENELIKIPVGNSPIVSMLEDQNGIIWIGTYLDGLYSYKIGKITHYTTANSGLASNNIWSMKEDRYGNLWLGTLGGAIQCLRKDAPDLNTMETYCEWVQHPLDIFYDGGDKLYIATVYGLVITDIKTRECQTHLGNYRGTQPFKFNLLTNVYRDSRAYIWMGHAEGLSLWDQEKDTLYHINKDNGLRDNIIQGITEDLQKNIWVITNNGLSVITLQSGQNGLFEILCRNFTTKDGLNDNFFNNHAIYRLRNGDMLLGGTEGYSMINPNKLIERNQSALKVTFTNLMVNNQLIMVDSVYNNTLLLKQPMEQTKTLTFRHSDKPITFNFTTGELLYADKVKYAYQLEGYHEQWNYTNENKIEFSSLPPDTYLLKIKACNSDGIWSDQISTLHITVKPPFYASMAAIIAYLLVFIGLITYTIQQFFKKHLARLEQQRIQIEQSQKLKLDDMKLRFFTNISHDLRTPLTLIISPIQALLNGPLDDTIRKKLEIVSKSADHLFQLINSLLDFRKLDAGAETLNLRAGDLSGMIQELCIPFFAFASDRKIQFDFIDQSDKTTLLFDHDKLKKILLNLIGNAFKFTPDGGRIEVRILKNNYETSIVVTDTGVGISDADKALVFKRFYQSQQTPEQTGSGIGLHIVSEYVKMHQGIIELTDNHPSGSIFTINLPLAETEHHEHATPQHSDENQKNLLPEKLNVSSKPVLLFVDDNKDLCEFMAESIADEYDVILAHNGQEALVKLQEHDVNIVVSDVMMPVMSGTALCKQIKNNIQWSHIPVILLTARTSDENQIEGLQLGADDYITKPFNYALLKLRIKKFLEWTAKCHRAFSQQIDVAPGEITITSLDEQLIGKAIKVVEENISNTEFSVEELGAAVGLSRSHLYKKLMSITGKGPAEFIRTIRLKRGRQLLEKSQLQIAEIAYAVGFNSPKRFTINFKSEFGLSPSDYLRSFQKAK